MSQKVSSIMDLLCMAGKVERFKASKQNGTQNSGLDLKRLAEVARKTWNNCYYKKQLDELVKGEPLKNCWVL